MLQQECNFAERDKLRTKELALTLTNQPAVKTSRLHHSNDCSVRVSNGTPKKSDKAITDKIENSHSSLNCFTIADTRTSESMVIEMPEETTMKLALQIPHEIAYLFPDSYNYIVDRYTRHTPESFLGAETQTFSLQAWINAEDQTKAVPMD